MPQHIILQGVAMLDVQTSPDNLEMTSTDIARVLGVAPGFARCVIAKLRKLGLATPIGFRRAKKKPLRVYSLPRVFTLTLGEDQ